MSRRRKNHTTPWWTNVDGRVYQSHQRYMHGARVSVHRNFHSRVSPVKWWVQINVPFMDGEWVRVYARPSNQTIDTVRRFADRTATRMIEKLRAMEARP